MGKSDKHRFQFWADAGATSMRCLQKPREAFDFTHIGIGHGRKAHTDGCPGRDIEATQLADR